MDRIKNPDIDFYNGFRLAVKLLNSASQNLHMVQDKDDSPDKKSKATVLWAEEMLKDFNRFEQQMYEDLKRMHGMNMFIGSDDTYYITEVKE